MATDADKTTHGLSDELLTDADELEATEHQRRKLPPGTPDFTELSVEERHLAEDLTIKAIRRRQLEEQQER